MTTCPAFAVDGGVADLLRVVDCQTHAAVADGYARLFGTGGTFGGVLTAALTLYIALFALRLMTGRAGLSLGALAPRMLTIGLVLTFVTSWPAYQTVVFDLLTRGPEQVATVMIGGEAGATRSFVRHVDKLAARLTEAGGEGAGEPPAPRKAAAAFAPKNLLNYSATILLAGTLGPLVIAKIILAMLLAVGPLFILLALHAGTRGLFEGWLRTAGLFALAPLLTILVGSAGVALLQPMIAALDGGVEPRLAMMLFAGALVYAALLLVAFRTAVGLTASWKLPAAIGRTERVSASAEASARSHATPTDASARIGSVVAAVSRDDAMTSPARATALAALPHAANDGGTGPATAPNAAPARARHLGQTFRGRTPSARPTLSGTIGA